MIEIKTYTRKQQLYTLNKKKNKKTIEAFGYHSKNDETYIAVLHSVLYTQILHRYHIFNPSARIHFTNSRLFIIP